MNIETASGDQVPFSDPDTMFAGFSKEDVIKLAYISGDFMLAIDELGVVRDIAVNVRDHSFANQWVGQKWADTVTIESQPKIMQLLDVSQPVPASWRQVNYLYDGDYIPVNYKLIRPKIGQIEHLVLFQRR